MSSEVPEVSAQELFSPDVGWMIMRSGYNLVALEAAMGYEDRTKWQPAQPLVRRQTRYMGLRLIVLFLVLFAPAAPTTAWTSVEVLALLAVLGLTIWLGRRANRQAHQVLDGRDWVEGLVFNDEGLRDLPNDARELGASVLRLFTGEFANASLVLRRYLIRGKMADFMLFAEYSNQPPVCLGVWDQDGHHVSLPELTLAGQLAACDTFSGLVKEGFMPIPAIVIPELRMNCELVAMAGFIRRVMWSYRILYTACVLSVFGMIFVFRQAPGYVNAWVIPGAMAGLFVWAFMTQYQCLSMLSWSSRPLVRLTTLPRSVQKEARLMQRRFGHGVELELDGMVADDRRYSPRMCFLKRNGGRICIAAWQSNGEPLLSIRVTVTEIDGPN